MSGAVAAAMVARERRRITNYFTTAGATHKGYTIAYAPKRRLEKRVFARLTDFGAIKADAAGKYWLDEAKLSDFRKESLAKVLGIIALAGFAAAGAIAVSG